LYNKSELYRHFECIESGRNLAEAVKDFGEKNQLTQLVVDLKNTDPDDAFSSIPFEKGSFLLVHLEEKLGGPEVFNKYLRAHIDKFKGESIDTDQWKSFLYEYFDDQKSILDKVDWNGWLYTPGMPPVTLCFDQTIANKVLELSDKLRNEEIVEADPVFSEFNSNQKRELLSQLLEKEPLSIAKIESLDRFYKFGSTENSEILFRWIRLGVKAKWNPIISLGLKFVSSQGRMKFTRPVYRDLFNWDESKEQTISNFNFQRKFMHQTTAALVAKDLSI
jgi:leukotriene-A4 hydrolase